MKNLITRLKIVLGFAKSYEYSEVEIPLPDSWIKFDNGNSIGKKGSENGIIVFDCENIDGARITLEVQSDVAPFAVTFGIYGVMFHTDYSTDESYAITYIQNNFTKIKTVLNLYDIDEALRDEAWKENHDDLIEKLVYN